MRDVELEFKFKIGEYVRVSYGPKGTTYDGSKYKGQIVRITGLGHDLYYHTDPGEGGIWEYELVSLNGLEQAIRKANS